MEDRVEMGKDVVRKFLNLKRDFEEYLEAADMRPEDKVEFQEKFESLMLAIAQRFDHLHPHS